MIAVTGQRVVMEPADVAVPAYLARKFSCPPHDINVYHRVAGIVLQAADFLDDPTTSSKVLSEVAERLFPQANDDCVVAIDNQSIDKACSSPRKPTQFISQVSYKSSAIKTYHRVQGCVCAPCTPVESTEWMQMHPSLY